MLKNPDFETGYTNRGAVEVTVAEGWEPWWESGKPTDVPDPDEPGYLQRPEFKPEKYWKRVHSGSVSQTYFNTFATHHAGVYQTVKVKPGSKVRFSAWARVWSSSGNNPDVSENPGEYKAWVGIDPYGGTDPFSEQVVWSEPKEEYDTWFQLSVETTAMAPQITVFCRGRARWRVKNNHIWWDTARLEVEEPAERPLGQYESHYVLFPQGTTWDWYRAASGYLMHYRVTNGQSVDDAMIVHGALGHTITAINPSDEVLKVLQKGNFRLDVVRAETPEELKAVLDERVRTGKKFG